MLFHSSHSNTLVVVPNPSRIPPIPPTNHSISVQDTEFELEKLKSEESHETEIRKLKDAFSEKESDLHEKHKKTMRLEKDQHTKQLTRKDREHELEMQKLTKKLIKDIRHCLVNHNDTSLPVQSMKKNTLQELAKKYGIPQTNCPDMRKKIAMLLILEDFEEEFENNTQAHTRSAASRSAANQVVENID